MRLASDFRSLTARVVLLIVILSSISAAVFAQQRRGREPNQTYAERRARIAEMISNALKYFDKDRYTLFAWCVMSNHVHVVFD